MADRAFFYVMMIGSYKTRMAVGPPDFGTQRQDIIYAQKKRERHQEKETSHRGVPIMRS